MQNKKWQQLLNKAVKILDLHEISRDEWTFGGGTALAIYLNHRESYDIDIFLRDVQLINTLTPRVNRNLAKDVSNYTEASSFLKLKYENGEIDFIIAPLLTTEPWKLMDVEGKKIRVETPEEIIIKKLFYRAETLKSRDVIDTAAVYAARKEKLLQQASIIASKVNPLKRRWERLKPVFPREVQGLMIDKNELLETAPLLFEQFLSKL